MFCCCFRSDFFLLTRLVVVCFCCRIVSAEWRPTTADQSPSVISASGSIQSLPILFIPK
jgi:hypothetical protein